MSYAAKCDLVIGLGVGALRVIVDEARHVLDSCHGVPRINSFVDQFRGERGASELLELLQSNEADVVWLGVYVLSEIAFSKYDSKEYFSELYRLTQHENPSVRYAAISALYPFLGLANIETRMLLVRIRDDEDELVRGCLETLAGSLGIPLDDLERGGPPGWPGWIDE